MPDMVGYIEPYMGLPISPSTIMDSATVGRAAFSRLHTSGARDSDTRLTVVDSLILNGDVAGRATLKTYTH